MFVASRFPPAMTLNSKAAAWFISRKGLPGSTFEFRRETERPTSKPGKDFLEPRGFLVSYLPHVESD